MSKTSEILEFYADDILIAFNNCQKAGCSPLFMPELVIERINADKDSKYWQRWYTTLSMTATGQTQKGSKIVLYAHIPNYLSEAENIGAALKDLVNGAGIIPEHIWHESIRFAEQGAEGIFIVPHEKLMASPSGLISVDSALEHPQTIPFLGVDRITAEKYLQKHKQTCGKQIGVWHCNDFIEGKVLGRLLFFGYDGHELCGDDVLDFYTRFAGIRENVAEAANNPAIPNS